MEQLPDVLSSKPRPHSCLQPIASSPLTSAEKLPAIYIGLYIYILARIVVCVRFRAGKNQKRRKANMSKKLHARFLLTDYRNELDYADQRVI